MSDGPHKSLNLRPGWKKVAETADNAACSSDEIAEWIPAALKKDWRQEVPTSLVRQIRDTFVEHQASLFSDNLPDILEALRSKAAGAPLAGLFLDHAIETATSNHLGQAGFVQAIKAALIDRTINSVRQIDEHYYRKGSIDRSNDVRTRIESAVDQRRIANLAHELSGKKGIPPTEPPRKQVDLDQGVELS